MNKSLNFFLNLCVLLLYLHGHDTVNPIWVLKTQTIPSQCVGRTHMGITAEDCGPRNRVVQPMQSVCVCVVCKLTDVMEGSRKWSLRH
jgi:hypothetical protein